MNKIKKGLPYVIMIAPTLIIYTITTCIPVVWSFLYSFTNYDGLTDWKFVGLRNYKLMIQNETIREVFGNTFIYGLTVPVLITALAIPLAVVLTSNMKSKNFMRAVFYFPSVISGLFLGYIWNYILSPSTKGLINSIRDSLGQDPWLLLASPTMAMVLLILVDVWCSVGWHASIYIANIQTISPTYYEAADIDGATGWQKFRYITFPMLAPAMTTSVMLLLTGRLKAYDLPFALTKGGPGYATTMVTQQIVSDGIGSNRLGYTSAMAFVFMLIIALFTTIQQKAMTKREDELQ